MMTQERLKKSKILTVKKHRENKAKMKKIIPCTRHETTYPQLESVSESHNNYFFVVDAVARNTRNDCATFWSVGQLVNIFSAIVVASGTLSSAR